MCIAVLLAVSADRLVDLSPKHYGRVGKRGAEMERPRHEGASDWSAPLAAWSTVLLDVLDPGPQRTHLRPGLEDMELSFEALGKGDIVSVHSRNELPSRFRRAAEHSRDDPVVLTP